VHVNKVPVVATHRLVDEAAAQRLAIDVGLCEQHWQRLQPLDLKAKLQQVFAEQEFPAKPEAEQQLYGGFLPNEDKPLLNQVRRASLDDFRQQSFHFSDARYNRLLFSYRARYFADSLTEDERQTWRESCKWRLTDKDSGYLTLEQQAAEIDQLLADTDLSDKKRAVLDALQQWSKDMAMEFGLTN